MDNRKYLVDVIDIRHHSDNKNIVITKAKKTRMMREVEQMISRYKLSQSETDANKTSL